jgi:hypothetical protein
VVNDDAKIEILLITEDSHPNAYEVFRNLSIEMLLLLQPGVPRYRLKQALQFAPLKGEAKPPSALVASKGTNWRSRDSKMYRSQQMLREQMTTMLLKARAFVFFHVDGDKEWKNRDDSIREQFEKHHLRAVYAGIDHHRKTHPATPDSAELTQKIILIIPYYSIESWLYQNTNIALSKCKTDKGRKLIKDWQADPALADEFPKPKENCCLRDEHTLELASSAFPAQRVHDVKKSFHAAVEAMRACAPLADALHSQPMLPNPAM